jgi:flagellar hook protein FlgE
MSVTSALYTGVSGLLNNGEAMNVIGNNISNVNTVGFKQGRTLFSDMLSGNAAKNSQIGKGVQMQAVQNIFTQGSSQGTENITDMMIQGNSFFALQSPSSPVTTQNNAYLSRAGAFSVDKNLGLVNADGYQVLDTSGKPVVFVNSGTSPTTDFAKITKIDPNGIITFLATDGVTQNYYNASAGVAGVQSADAVNASAAIGNTTASVADAAITTASNASTTYVAAAAASAAAPTDTALAAAAAYALAALNSANASAASAASTALNAATAAFNAATVASTAAPSDAALAATTAAATTALADATASNTSAAAAALDKTGATVNSSALGTAAAASASATAIAAAAAAAVAGTTSSRAVNAANAATVQRIAVVTVADPGALSKVGGSLYQSTANAGVATTPFSLTANKPNGSSEQILSNTLEGSNVDMASEFVKMIVTQRAYSANSKTITTADQMTQEVLGLIR